MKVNDLRDIIVYYVRVNQDKEVNMKYSKDDPRGYKVKGKKMLPKPYNRRRNEAKKLGQSFSRVENALRTYMRNTANPSRGR